MRNLLDNHLVNPCSIHIHDLEGEVVPVHFLPCHRHVVQLIEDKSGDGCIFRIFQKIIVKIEVPEKIVDRTLTVNQPAIIALAGHDIRFLSVIIDISDKFLDYILQCYYSGAEAEFIAYESPADVPALHFLEHRIHVHILMEIYRLVHHLLQIEGAFPKIEDKILETQHSYHVVKITVSKGTTVTTIPDDLLGMTREEATRALHEADLNPVFDEVYSDEYEEGLVAQVRPGLGVEVEIGSDVTVYISMGPETKTTNVPNVLGRTEGEARALIEAAELTVGRVSSGYSDDYAEGEVMYQSLSGGSTVEEGSVVDLVISQGPEETEPETVEMPYVLEMSEDDARETLESRGLTVSAVHTGHSSMEAGLVYSASYSAGTELERGTSVELWVSIGEEPEPPTEPEPEPTEPTEPEPEPEPEPTEPTEPEAPSDSAAAQE